MNKPLENIKILDLTQYLPGPLATKVFSDLGAEVIKIETAEGDFLRNLPPFKDNESMLFGVLNKGKKSIRLNLQKEEGSAILEKLIKQADVVVHSYRGVRAQKLGLAFNKVSNLNPKVVLCELKAGFELEAGHDLNFMALSGALNNYQTGKLPNFQVADLMGGTLNSVSSILAALYAKEKTGMAQHVEVSMLEGTKYFLEFYFKAIRENGTDTLDILRGKVPCYNIYNTKDNKKLVIAALEPIFWANICSILKRDDLLDQQFDENGTKEMENIFKTKKLNEWLKLMPQRETTLNEVIAYTYKKPLFPTKFSNEIISISSESPKLSQHSESILTNLGYSRAEILRLKSEGVI